MANNMDGVKISVNNNSEGESEPVKEKKKRTVTRKKNVAAKPLTKKEPEEERYEEVAEERPAKKDRSKKSGGMTQMIVSIAVTALVVGGAVYAWQKNVTDVTVGQVKQASTNEKSDFENTIANIKSKLTGTETEKVELSKTLEDLKKKAALLVDAKVEYKNDEMGFSFEYPAAFGTVVSASSTAASGTLNSYSFESNPNLIFGGISQDYKSSKASGTPELAETKGYVEKDKKFFLLGNASQQYEIVPAKTIDFKGGKAILIDKKSFVLKAGQTVPVNIGENVAVILNLKNKKYSGLSFINSDFGALPLDGFVKLVGSIQVK